MKMIVSVKHNKQISEVRNDMDKLATEMKMSVVWNADSTEATGVLDYSGFSVPGKINISATAVTLSVELPRIARMASGKISREVTKQIEQALS
jgi:hypothetical protein